MMTSELLLQSAALEQARQARYAQRKFVNRIALTLSLILFLLSMAGHIVWWRCRPPRNHTAALLLVFTATPILATSLWFGLDCMPGLTCADLPGIALFYSAATCFAFPSLYEGFGIPIIEALYAKTPVITSKGGCFSEAGGPNSIYIDPSNIFALESKIKLLLSNENLCSSMAQNGLNYAHEHFDDQKISNKIIAVYQNLVLNKELKLEFQN